VRNLPARDDDECHRPVLTSRLPGASLRRDTGCPRTLAATIGATWRHVHREQTPMRERRPQANRATVPSAGPLRRVLTRDGHRLATCLPPLHAGASDAA
jgi:hypothetical protein